MHSYSAYWPDPLGGRCSPARRGLGFALVLGFHVAALWAVLELAVRPEVREAASELIVRLVELPPAMPETKPEQPTPRPQPVPAKPIAQQPVLAAAPDAPVPVASFAVPPQPVAPAVIEAAPSPAPTAMTAARFDADYLSNPKPVYPASSRRLGEEGKVLLRVHVNAEGAAMVVEIKNSCGFPRLDEAARSAVERWRFVPARRGSEAVDSWVAVPVVFSLQTS